MNFRHFKRRFFKVWDFLILRKTSLAGLGMIVYLSTRLGNNMEELEENTKQHKIFDPVKAKAQVDVYKEIYNLMDEEESELKRLPSAVSDKEKQKIKDYFSQEKLSQIDKEELERELQRLQVEIDSLEEVKSTHQGFKFLRTTTSKDVFEDALYDKKFDEKFMKDKQNMIGDKPKTI
ncbi:unnamed protein product [Moneuplotes crassus]|uniref:Uncharacterized protein n=1 Tax=Euplotes crassus TaxID=5936 RepID=A0AAD1Y0Z3_EUPCR|nr:unnamed protein product [Moneuplotes crassus]